MIARALLSHNRTYPRFTPTSEACCTPNSSHVGDATPAKRHKKAVNTTLLMVRCTAVKWCFLHLPSLRGCDVIPVCHFQYSLDVLALYSHCPSPAGIWFLTSLYDGQLHSLCFSVPSSHTCLLPSFSHIVFPLTRPRCSIVSALFFEYHP